jgi:hypothetical protein
MSYVRRLVIHLHLLTKPALLPPHTVRAMLNIKQSQTALAISRANGTAQPVFGQVEKDSFQKDGAPIEQHTRATARDITAFNLDTGTLLFRTIKFC